MSDEARATIDRLQATLTLSLGRKPTLQEVVDEICALAWDRRADLLANLSGWRPATPEETAVTRAYIHALNEAARREPPEAPMSEEDRVIYDEDEP